MQHTLVSLHHLTIYSLPSSPALHRYSRCQLEVHQILTINGLKRYRPVKVIFYIHVRILLSKYIVHHKFWAQIKSLFLAIVYQLLRELCDKWSLTVNQVKWYKNFILKFVSSTIRQSSLFIVFPSPSTFNVSIVQIKLCR